MFICFFLIGFDQKQVCADRRLWKYSCSYWRAHTTEQIHRREAQQSAQCMYTKVSRQHYMFLSKIINILLCTFTDLFERLVASLLLHAPPGRAAWVPALAGDIVLCSWARHFTLTVPLSTQVYKWVLANLMLGVTLRWTSVPSRGSKNTPSYFMLQKPG